MWPVLLACLALTLGSVGNAQTAYGSIGGTVLDSNGEGVSAHINVFQERAVDGLPYFQQRCHVLSNTSGQFNCPPVPVGKYIVREIPVVSVRGLRNTSERVVSPAFYPGVSDLVQAETISVTSGGMGWAQIRVPDVSPVSISGKLIPSASEAAFALYAASDGLTVDVGAQVQYNGRTGEFKASGLMPGHYLLEPDWLVNNFEHRAYLPIDLGTNSIHNLRVTPLANAEIEGHIDLVGGSDAFEIVLRRVDGLFPPYSTKVEGGSFHFDDVVAGEYVLYAVGRGDTYVSSVSVDGQPTQDARFELTREGNHMVDVALTGPACTIQGDVTRWSSAAKSADVVAVSESTGIIYHTLTDAQRHFVINGLPPGSYRLFAWPGPNLVPYRIASMRRRYEYQASEVSLDQGAMSEPVSLTPI